MDNIQVETYSSHDEPKAQPPQESPEDTGKQLEMDTSEAAEDSDSVEETEESSEEEQTEDSETSEDDSEESDDDSEEDEESDEDSDAPKKVAKKSGFAKRIAKLKAKQAEAERAAEYWKSKALRGDEADTSGEQREGKATQSQLDNPYLKDVGEKPDPDDYESQDEYLDALTDWKIDVREAKKQFEADQNKAKTAAQKQAETFQNRVQEYAETVEDWDETLESVSDIQMNPGLMQAIMTSEFAPHLMYELSKNRSELERINKMDPASTLRAIGRLESKFESAGQSSSSKQETRRTTKAPKPPTPVGRNSSSATKKSVYDENLTQREYEELMAERERKRAASSF